MRLALALLLVSCAGANPVGPRYRIGDKVCRRIAQDSCDIELCWPLGDPGAMRVDGYQCRAMLEPLTGEAL